MPEIQDYAYANARIGDVESRINIESPEMDVHEIDHVAVRDPVHEVPHNAATKQTEADLGQAIAQTEGVSPEENRDQCASSEKRQKKALPREHTPCGPCVSDMNNIQVTRNQLDIRAGAMRMHWIERYACRDP